MIFLANLCRVRSLGLVYYSQNSTGVRFWGLDQSPIAPIDVGVEYLWGSRRNKDGNKGTANQLQIVATFNF